MDEHLLRRHEAQRISKAREDDTTLEIRLERECKANARRRSIDNVNHRARLNVQQEAFAKRISGEDDAARKARLSIQRVRNRRNKVAKNVIIEAGLAMCYEVHATRRFDMCPKNLKTHYLGRMEKICTYCGALYWSDERLSTSSELNPQSGSCCLKGKVCLALMQDALQNLC
jgi:hypothetical protein